MFSPICENCLDEYLEVNETITIGFSAVTCADDTNSSLVMSCRDAVLEVFINYNQVGETSQKFDMNNNNSIEIDHFWSEAGSKNIKYTVTVGGSQQSGYETVIVSEPVFEIDHMKLESDQDSKIDEFYCTTGVSARFTLNSNSSGNLLTCTLESKLSNDSANPENQSIFSTTEIQTVQSGLFPVPAIAQIFLAPGNYILTGSCRNRLFSDFQGSRKYKHKRHKTQKRSLLCLYKTQTWFCVLWVL